MCETSLAAPADHAGRPRNSLLALDAGVFTRANRVARHFASAGIGQGVHVGLQLMSDTVYGFAPHGGVGFPMFGGQALPTNTRWRPTGTG